MDKSSLMSHNSLCNNLSELQIWKHAKKKHDLSVYTSPYVRYRSFQDRHNWIKFIYFLHVKLCVIYIVQFKNDYFLLCKLRYKTNNNWWQDFSQTTSFKAEWSRSWISNWINIKRVLSLDTSQLCATVFMQNNPAKHLSCIHHGTSLLELIAAELQACSLYIQTSQDHSLVYRVFLHTDKTGHL